MRADAAFSNDRDPLDPFGVERDHYIWSRNPLVAGCDD